MVRGDESSEAKLFFPPILRALPYLAGRGVGVSRSVCPVEAAPVYTDLSTFLCSERSGQTTTRNLDLPDDEKNPSFLVSVPLPICTKYSSK